MIEQLRYLIALQLLEDKKVELLRSSEGIPERIAELEDSFAVSEEVYLVKKTEYERAQQLRRSRENEVSDMEAKRSRSKSRLNEVKSNKEYQALLKEIEDLSGEINRKEEETLEYMETVEALEGLVGDLEKEIAERRKEMERSKEKLLLGSQQARERITRLEAMQKSLKDKIHPVLLRQCFSLFKSKAGVAVGTVEEGVCQMCHMTIQPQKYIEIQRDEEIHQCPHCHRFIYWPGHEAYTTPLDELEDALID